jgi:hypothetical protein
MKPWLKLKKKKKFEKKNIINLSSHGVTGPLASLSIKRLRKKMRN